MAERTLTVKIIGDSKSLEQAFNRSQKSAKGFQGQVVAVNSGLGKLAAATGVTIGLGVFFDQARKATQAASSLNEEVNKSEVVFGDSAAAVLAWSRTTANALGISERAALQASAGFGQIFQTAGVNQKQSAELSRSLVQLAADMASFNNIDPSVSLEKLRSGLVGEAEPLRTVGVLLSEARVQQEAYDSGIARSGSKLTEQQKVLARYQIILKDTGKAQGDFARTSDSLANQQRILAANSENLRAELGKRLLPTIKDLGTISLGAIAGVEKLGKALDDLGSAGPGPNFLDDIFQFSIPALVGRLADDIQKLRGQTQKVTIPLEITFDTTEIIKPKAGGGRTPRIFEPGFKPGGAPPVPVIPPETINRIFDAKVTRQLNVAADQELPKQLAALDRIAAGIQDEIGRVHDVTRKLTLRDELLSVQRQKASVRQQLAADFLDSLSLGVDRAKLTETFSDDVAALDALERGIRQQIATSGRTNDLERQLLQIQEQRTAIKRAQRQAMLDALQFRVDRAELTASLSDDIAAVKALEAGIKSQIREEGRTLDLQQQLFDLRKKRLDLVNQQRQQRQFRALGLTAEGDQPIPGVANLRKQLGGLDKAIDGTFLDTRKTESVLNRVRKVLSGGLGAVGRDVRSKIADILADLRNQLRDNDRELTKGRAVSSNAILSGLGLDRDTRKQLEARLANIGAGGKVLAGAGRGTQSAFGFSLGAAAPIVVHTTVQMDSQKVGSSVTRVQQKRKRRLSSQTTGPFGGQ